MDSEDDIDIVIDEQDEVQDYKFLNKQLPKTGEKDFEPDGTEYQVDKLDESKNLMYNSLSHPIQVHEKSLLQGIYIPLDEETVIFDIRGNYFKDLGRHASVHGKPIIILNKLETLYLLERGSLILYLNNDKILGYLSGLINSFSYHDLIPVTLQSFYSYLTSFEIQKYQVFAYLKRLGYLVQDYHQFIFQENTESLTSRLFKRLQFPWFCTPRTHLGIDAKSVHYQTYTQILKKLNIIPSAKTYSSLEKSFESTYDIQFNVWKPRNAFSKKILVQPDFQVSITQEFPSLNDIHHLLNKLNYELEPLDFDLDTRGKDSKLRHGTGRSIIVAVINNGVNFINLSEVDFSLKDDKKVNGFIH